MTWDDAAASRRFDEADLADDAYRTDQTFEVAYRDKWKGLVGYEGGYASLQFSFKENAAGGFKMVVPREEMLRDNFDHIFRNPDGADATIPLTVTTAAKRWDGYLTRAAIVIDEDGTETIDIEGIHCAHHVATLALWPSPFAPIWAQWPRHMFIISPAITLCVIYIGANLIRRQSSNYPGQWSDAPEWAAAGGGAMWPIAVVPVNPLTDTSVWRGASVRMDMADQALYPLLAGTGISIEVSFFLPDEGDEQPAPQYYNFDRPTVVIQFKDNSGITGPTGTLLDGILSWVEEWVDDTTLIRYPAFAAQTEWESAYEYSGPFGTKRALPHVWYRRGEYSGLGPSEVAIHKPAAIDVIVGGKSPGWVNAGIEIAIKNLLAWLGLAIGVPGLDALYRGQLDDVFLAWAVWRDSERARRAGPFAFGEVYVTGSDKAYNINGVMTGRKGLHDTRGYVSKRVTVVDAAPYLIGRDFDLSSQIGFDLGEELDDPTAGGLLFTDRVTELTGIDDENGGRWEMVIGDGSEDEDTVVRAWDRLAVLGSAIKDLATDVGADLDLIIF